MAWNSPLVVYFPTFRERSSNFGILSVSFSGIGITVNRSFIVFTLASNLCIVYSHGLQTSDNHSLVSMTISSDIKRIVKSEMHCSNVYCTVPSFS